MSIRRNIRIMYAISLLQGMVFYASIATLYRQRAGLNFFQISLIESVSLVISIALEMPWGVVADRIGYKKSMIVCCMLYFASKLVFWQANGFGMFLIERILLGVVFAGLSGLDQSILYCSCNQDEAQKVFGIYSSLGTAGLLLASAVYSLWIGENYRLAGLMTAAAYGFAALLSLGLKEVKAAQTQTHGTLASFQTAIRDLFGNPQLILLALACALLSEVEQKVTIFLNQMQYVRCGMSIAAIGAVFIGISLLELLSGASAYCTQRLGAKRLGGGVFLACAVLCLLLAVTENAILSVLCVAMVQAGCSLLGPLTSDLTNRCIHTPDRATALSVVALLGDGIGIAANLCFAQLADWNLSAAMLLGAILCAIGLGMFVRSQKM